ncbi:GNAT family N-acetyltransferase [Arachidicoccus terrestris]|uniref:GNAT family N-acetyltransferase n=1 Tax=Arachidicoccus terrestris TaxID=2875539 RepID=UPI001CC5A6C2|nr:GNAT family N-acetyltransferase [Arachidicoccus terrestris]UAY57214.1 GNAT family N-acetyltransferase [Arachidicoccus terrestris]
MIEIVPANIADIHTIQQIAHQTWPETFGDILSKEQIDYMLEMMYSTTSLITQMVGEGHHFVLARKNGIHMGYASFESNYKKLSKTKIHKIYVLPDTQGTGVGRSLIAYIEQAAKATSADKKLLLHVNRDNKAVKFYEHIGFSVEGTQDLPIGNGFLMEDFIMEKNI